MPPQCTERARDGRGKPLLSYHNIGFLACFHTISLECSCFGKIAILFSCSRWCEAAGIAHRLPRNL